LLMTTKLRNNESKSQPSVKDEITDEVVNDH